MYFLIGGLFCFPFNKQKEKEQYSIASNKNTATTDNFEE